MSRSRPGRPIVYLPYGDVRYAVLTAALALVVGLLLLNLFTTAFERIGFSWREAVALLVASLLGSGVNVPVLRVRSSVPVAVERLVRHGPFVHRVPVRYVERHETVVALNVGGAVVPVLVSAYLLATYPSAIPVAAMTAVVVLLIVNRLAEPVQGVGIVVLGLWPPVITAITVVVLSAVLGASNEARFVAAYAGGTLGTLIGADLLNLGAMSRLGTGIASIGGAGTFDGVFLAGVIAVLLA